MQLHCNYCQTKSEVLSMARQWNLAFAEGLHCEYGVLQIRKPDFVTLVNQLYRSERSSSQSAAFDKLVRRLPQALSRTVRPRASTPVSLLCSVLLLGILASGCTTYRQQNRIIDYWTRGDIAGAQREAAQKSASAGNGKDAVIWRLEHATILRSASKYEESNREFDAADAQMNRYAEAAKVRLGRETLALLSNQAQLPYEGRPYDRIMVSTYEALNELALGRPDRARVNLIRAYQRQQEAVQLNQRRIERAKEEIAEARQRDGVAQAEADPQFKGRLDSIYAPVRNLQPYADYVNPFTVYLDGLFFMTQAADGSDLERARKSFERAQAFAPDNPYIRADLESIEDLFRGKPLPPTTYVIFETGRAPVRDQIRIDVPILFTRVSYIGAAFPVLEFQGDYLPHLEVSAQGKTQRTALVSSMDRIIAQDFNNELPSVITKTIAAAIAKGAAAYAINTAAGRQDEALGLLAQFLTAAFQAAVNIADLRTWTTLPKEFHVCRVPTPPDRRIELIAPGTGQKVSVDLTDGTINLVYVKSITTASPLLVSQVKLK